MMTGSAVLVRSRSSPRIGARHMARCAGRARPRRAADAAQRGAPIDLTGNWVSVVTEDWRWRMVTPPKGDVASVPVNAEGRRVADGWDLEADNAAGNQCKAFGVGGIMRQPGRLRISWQDDDAEARVRRRHADAAADFARGAARRRRETWQGFSRAEWEGRRRGNAGSACARRSAAARARSRRAAAARVCAAVRRRGRARPRAARSRS